MFQREHILYGSSFRHIRDGFPNILTFGAPLPSSVESVTNRHKKIGDVKGQSARLLSSSKAAFKLLIGRNDKALLSDSFHAIATSDVVIDRGGPFFAARNRFLNISLYRYAYPLLIARKFGVPFGFAPGSHGPFTSKWSRWFVRKLFDDAAFIMARDAKSKEELVACSINPERIALTLDSAFWVEACMSERVKRAMDVCGLEPGQFLAVTTRQWHADRQRRYHRELAATIDALVPRYFCRAVLVTNVVDPSGQITDDKPATEALFEMIQQKDYVSVLTEDLRPDELVGLYGQAQLVLGTRLHSVIMALAAGTPAVAVSYVGHKTHGLMQLVGLPQYTLDLDTFSGEAAVPLVLSALSTRDQIGERIEKLRQQGNKVFQATFKNVCELSELTP
jgi:polysaccharide pyruvyl transferase WcaK-like protein